MRRPSALLVLLTSLATILPLSTTAFAAAPTKTASPAAQAIRHLQKIGTTSYQAATAFYLYNVLNRDPQQYKKMQALLAEGDILVPQAANPALQIKWTEFKRACTTAKFTSEGVADNDSINAVDSALTNLASNVRSNISEQQSSGKIAVDKMAEMLYDQYVTMQIMTAAYLRKSADYFGGAIVASESGTVEIDKLAEKFGTQLATLNRHYAKNPKIAPLLKVVTTKWVFIRNSFINFNQDNVPFVVGRYNQQITDKLLEAYSLAI